MAWNIEVVDGCAVVRMNTNKVNVQNDQFFADLHGAFDRLEREFGDLPVVLTGQGDVFSAGIDFRYSFEIFGSGEQKGSRLVSRTAADGRGGNMPSPVVLIAARTEYARNGRSD